MFRQVDINKVQVIFPVLPCTKDDPFSPALSFKYPKTKSSGGMPEFLSLKDARELQWYYEYQPYLAFIPKDDVFEGPIFGRLQGNRSTFEGQVFPQGPQRFIFHADLSQSWLRLESALGLLISTFYTRLTPLTAPRPPLPSETRFYEPKPSIKNVVSSVLFAQKCFLFLVAELRFSVAKCMQLAAHEDFTSYKKLFGLRSLDELWMKDLAESKAMTAMTLAGCILNPGDMQSGFDVHLFAVAGAPVYITFATISRRFIDVEGTPLYTTDEFDIIPLINQKSLDNFFLPFLYADVGIRVKYEWSKRYKDKLLQIPFVQSSKPIFAIPLPPPPQPSSNLPTPMSPSETINPPHPNDELESPLSPINDPTPIPDDDDRLLKVCWCDHYKSVKACIELDFECEGDDEELEELNDYRETGILVNKSNALPTVCYDDFYIWEPTSSHSEFLLRRRLDISEARSIWAMYPPTHRIHNPLKNEWDLYHTSCDFITLSRNEEEFEFTDSTLYNLRSGGVTNPNIQNAARDIKDDRKKLLNMRLDEVQSHLQPLFCENDPLENARRRFGFLFPEPPLVNNSSESKAVAWWFYLGHSNCELSNPIETQVREIIWLLQNKRHEELASLLDIFARWNFFLEINDVRIRHFPFAIFEYSEKICRNVYILDFPQEEDPDWFIGIPQASDVVLALRQGWAKNRRTLIENFLRLGIRFFTLAPVPEGFQHRQLEHREFTLPTAPADHKYTMADFYYYEKRREELLDSPYGRIAGRSGGVVARLWRRDYTKFHHRMEDVCTGPTEAALWKGIRVDLGGRLFYDDELTSQMDAYISGQYEPMKSKKSCNFFIVNYRLYIVS